MYSLNVFPLLEFPFINRDCFFWGDMENGKMRPKNLFLFIRRDKKK